VDGQDEKKPASMEAGFIMGKVDEPVLFQKMPAGPVF